METTLIQLPSAQHPSYTELLVLVKELEKTVAEQAKIIEAQAKALEAKDEIISAQAEALRAKDDIITGLTEEIADLRKELAKYENPHTPSSAKRFKEKPKDQTPRKRGAPKGHRGATRPTPEPEEYVPVTADHCERCGSTNLEEVGVDPAVREDLIRQLRQIKVTQYDRGMYRCRDCGHEFTAKHEDCPQEGRFGIKLLTYVTMLKFMLRGVLRKIGDFTAHVNGFNISPKGVHDMLLRVGGACQAEYQRALERVRAAPWKYVDETGIRVNGKNWWLWIFRTTTDVLVVIRPSRGRDVLEEILGAKINGAGVSDGWRSYNVFQVLQRCWAHLLREVDAYKDKPGGEELSRIMHRKFKRLKEFLARGPLMEERKRVKKRWDTEMAKLVEEFASYEDIQKPLTYIRNGLGCWYTCLLYPGMEPTNNLGEQAMREHVIMRKIIGTFRSERGAEYYQYIASLLATWQLQSKDVYKELEDLLRKELCLR
jgi:rubrerythrin